MKNKKESIDFLIHAIKELLDALNTDPGHMILTFALLIIGLVVIGHFKMASEGHELFILAIGLLGRAMNSTGKANGQTKPPANPSV